MHEKRKPARSIDPLQWTYDDVFRFVACHVKWADANKFSEHRIGGQALGYLRVETLVEVLGITLGDAANIKCEFERACKSYSRLDETN